MKRQVIGVVLATLAMYFWGFIYWGPNPLPYSAWKQAPDDEAAGQALLEHFPESGTYYVPGIHHDPETRAKLSEAGPVGFVHIDRGGRPVVDPSVMVQGFLLVLITAVLLSAVLRAAPGLSSYGARVRLVALVGLTAAVMIDVGDSVWWRIPLGWKIYQALYDCSVMVVGGLVLAKFVTPPEAGSAV